MPDLMDRSKVEAAARAAGVTLELVGQPCRLATAVLAARTDRAGQENRDGPDLVIVDLSRPGALDAVRELGGRARILGFGSHVDRSLLSDAREAGCDQVMARSAFFTRLAELLGGLGSGNADQARAATNSSDVIGSENIGKS